MRPICKSIDLNFTARVEAAETICLKWHKSSFIDNSLDFHFTHRQNFSTFLCFLFSKFDIVFISVLFMEKVFVIFFAFRVNLSSKTIVVECSQNFHSINYHKPDSSAFSPSPFPTPASPKRQAKLPTILTT